MAQRSTYIPANALADRAKLLRHISSLSEDNTRLRLQLEKATGDRGSANGGVAGDVNLPSPAEVESQLVAKNSEVERLTHQLAEAGLLQESLRLRVEELEDAEEILQHEKKNAVTACRLLDDQNTSQRFFVEYLALIFDPERSDDELEDMRQKLEVQHDAAIDLPHDNLHRVSCALQQHCLERLDAVFRNQDSFEKLVSENEERLQHEVTLLKAQGPTVQVVSSSSETKAALRAQMSLTDQLLLPDCYVDLRQREFVDFLDTHTNLMMQFVSGWYKIEWDRAESSRVMSESAQLQSQHNSHHNNSSSSNVGIATGCSHQPRQQHHPLGMVTTPQLTTTTTTTDQEVQDLKRRCAQLEELLLEEQTKVHIATKESQQAQKEVSFQVARVDKIKNYEKQLLADWEAAMVEQRTNVFKDLESEIRRAYEAGRKDAQVVMSQGGGSEDVGTTSITNTSGRMNVYSATHHPRSTDASSALAEPNFLQVSPMDNKVETKPQRTTPPLDDGPSPLSSNEDGEVAPVVSTVRVTNRRHVGSNNNNNNGGTSTSSSSSSPVSGAEEGAVAGAEVILARNAERTSSNPGASDRRGSSKKERRQKKRSNNPIEPDGPEQDATAGNGDICPDRSHQRDSYFSSSSTDASTLLEELDGKKSRFLSKRSGVRRTAEEAVDEAIDRADDGRGGAVSSSYYSADVGTTGGEEDTTTHDEASAALRNGAGAGGGATAGTAQRKHRVEFSTAPASFTYSANITTGAGGQSALRHPHHPQLHQDPHQHQQQQQQNDGESSSYQQSIPAPPRFSATSGIAVPGVTSATSYSVSTTSRPTAAAVNGGRGGGGGPHNMSRSGSDSSISTLASMSTIPNASD